MYEEKDLKEIKLNPFLSPGTTNEKYRWIEGWNEKIKSYNKVWSTIFISWEWISQAMHEPQTSERKKTGLQKAQ